MHYGPLKIVIIGASGHAPYVLWGMKRRPKEASTLAGLAPGSAGESIDKFAGMCREDGHSPAIYDDWRRMLDETKPDIAAVDPFYCDHERIILELLDRKIHVFADKPLAFTLEGVQRIRKAHASSGVELGCMLNMRYEPAIRAAYEAVKAGAIGETRLIHAHKSYRLGQRPPFYRRRDSFGGLIPWVGSHAIDLIAAIGQKPFVSVTAAHSTQANRGNGEMEVSAGCLFRLADGAIGTASMDYLRPAAAPTHEDDRVRAAGTDGVIEVRDGKTILIDANGLRELPPDPSGSLFGDFMDQVLGTGQSLLTAEEAYRNTEISLLAQQAADAGTTVSLEG